MRTRWSLDPRASSFRSPRRPLLALVLSSVVVLPLTACKTGRPGPRAVMNPTLQPPDMSWALLAENDVVRVTIHGHPEASTGPEGERVDEAGILSIPLVGLVPVAGLTVAESRGIIERIASEYILEPEVSVSVLEFAARDFYILGQIAEPGPYKLDRPLTALQGLSHGGRVLSGADRENIYLMRRRGQVFEVQAFSYAHPGPDGLIALQPNDILFVPRSIHGVFAEEVLPYLQGIGFASSLPIAIRALTY